MDNTVSDINVPEVNTPADSARGDLPIAIAGKPAKPRKRKLTKDEQELMAEVVSLGRDISVLLAILKRPSSHVDPKWLDIGANDLEKGMIFLKRSITKPDTFA